MGLRLREWRTWGSRRVRDGWGLKGTAMREATERKSRQEHSIRECATILLSCSYVLVGVHDTILDQVSNSISGRGSSLPDHTDFSSASSF
jgi:hypothetical protein